MAQEFELLTQGTSHRLIRNGQPMWPGEAVIVLNYQAGEIARLEKELAGAKAQRVPDGLLELCRRIVSRRNAAGGYLVLTVDIEALEAMLAAAKEVV